MIVANRSERELKMLAHPAFPIIGGGAGFAVPLLFSIGLYTAISSKPPHRIVSSFYMIATLSTGYCTYKFNQQMRHDAVKRLAELHSKNNT
jgi:hypothetical protein